MKLLSKLCLAILWWCIFSCAACAEDPARQLADALIRTQQYDAAITEYKRFLCFNPASPEASAVTYQIGIAYLRLQQFDAAYAAFRQAQELARTPEEHNQRCLDTAVECLAAASYLAAEKNLTRVTSLGTNTPQYPRACFLLGVCKLYTGQWAEAQHALNLYAESGDPAQRARLATLLSVPPPMRSPAHAARLSEWVPGWGQWYAGDRCNAVNAFSVNLLFGGNLVNAVLGRQDIVTVGIALSCFLRYYQGNSYHAARMTRVANRSEQQRYAQMKLHELLAITRAAAVSDGSQAVLPATD